MLSNSRLKHWLAPAAQGIAVLLLLANTLLWWLPDGQALISKAFATLTTENLPMTASALAAGWAISSLHLLILLRGILAMAAALRLLANGDYFHPTLAEQLRCFGLTLVIFGSIAPLVRMLIVLAITLANPEGHQALALSLEMHDVLMALIGALLLMLAHALREAAAIADDNRQIV